MGGSVCFRVWEIGGFFFSLSFLFGNLTARTDVSYLFRDKLHQRKNVYPEWV